MKESYSEGARHTGPESCAGTREGVPRSVDRGMCGPDTEPRKENRSRVPTYFRLYGRQHRVSWTAQGWPGPRVVQVPEHVQKLLAREPGDPACDLSRWCQVREAKSKESS